MTDEAIENRVKYALVKDEKGMLKRKPSGYAIRGDLSTDLWPYVERMRASCMLLKGGTSTLVTDETLEWMKTTVPDLRVVTVDGVGHMIPQGKPEEFEQHLRDDMRRGLSGRCSVHAMSAHVCGLDVHKRYTYATILGPDGEILAQKKMPNEEAPDFLEPYPVEHVAMEATTSIAPLYRRLASEGYQVHVVHPKETRTIAKTRIKTDRTSSRALAELLRVNGLPESYFPVQTIRGMLAPG